MNYKAQEKPGGLASVQGHVKLNLSSLVFTLQRFTGWLHIRNLIFNR